MVAFLAILLAAGLFTFRDYGASWDEPLFYKYADALGYAYTPANWWSGHFDLNLSYGPSGDDHKNRGPAYLLLGRAAVYLLESMNVQSPEGWHLVNYLTFLVGAFFLYSLCLRWMSHWPAFAATALFVFQPLLWGHAFINPKDPPFLVASLGSIYLGFRMVDRFSKTTRAPIWEILAASVALGLAISTRILGPLAGLVVALYLFARRPSRQMAAWMVLYAITAGIVTIATWPYLWENPLLRFREVLRFMSANPTVLPVLFNDQLFRAYDLPRRYLPFYLSFTLTEPVWPLFTFGAITACKTAFIQIREARIDFPGLAGLVLMLGWLFGPVTYVLLRRPPTYDGFRHFLFILPPIFIFTGLAFDSLFHVLRRAPWRAILITACLAPGILGIIQLHPYEYTYYNAFIGGTGNAFRHYETDYWLTCYKDAVQELHSISSEPLTLYVHREAALAGIYAPDDMLVKEERGALNEIKSGDYILVNTRTNEDLKTFRDAPPVVTVGRLGASFCIIKQIP